MICSDTANVKRGYTEVKIKQNIDKKKITLSWQKISFAKGYEVYRSTKKGKIGEKISSLKGAGKTTYVEVEQNVQNGKTYYYQVRPYWSEKGKKKTASSNVASVICRKYVEDTNNKALLEKMGLKNYIATDSNADMNTFGFIKSGTTKEVVYPAIKYQFDGKTLTIHLYVKYSSYTFKEKFYPDGTLIYSVESLDTILKKKSDGKSYVASFEKGLQKYYHGQLVEGVGADFGDGVNFKTALKIHRSDDRTEKYNVNQNFIEVMIGGINIYAFADKEEFKSDSDPYWYHAQYGLQKIYMPEDGQVAKNKYNRSPNKSGEYLQTSAHEMGHILGLADAYYDITNRIDRCVENIETCILKDDIYYNMMHSSHITFTANDFEMMLRAYQSNGKGVTVKQYYKNFGKNKISGVIDNKKDNKTKY